MTRLDYSWSQTFSLFVCNQVNGDIPPRLKKSAHEVILEFIRSRPPLNPVSTIKKYCRFKSKTCLPFKQMISCINLCDSL